MSEKKLITRLLWVDMEMTGLDVKKEVPIEIACIVTDLDFTEREIYHAVIQQPQSYLDQMDDWNKKTHGASGLLAQIPSGKDASVVETEVLQLIDRHFQGERPVLAGNSISQDRLFIDQHLQRLAARLHYRMLDVTSWKIIFQNKFQKTFDKKNAHKAVDDIRESIRELQFYLGHFEQGKQ
jgi:oligoribonuclease